MKLKIIAAIAILQQMTEDPTRKGPLRIFAGIAEGERLFAERERLFSQIDRATIQSKLLERYLAALRGAGLKGAIEFYLSDAVEAAYGMGFPMRTRIVAVMSEDIKCGRDIKPDEFVPLIGGTISQIQGAGGYGEPKVDFDLDEQQGLVIANRFDYSQSRTRPYWLSDDSITAFDLTTSTDFIPANMRDFRNSVASTYIYKGHQSKVCFPLSELGGHEQEIQAYFGGVTSWYQDCVT